MFNAQMTQFLYKNKFVANQHCSPGEVVCEGATWNVFVKPNGSNSYTITLCNGGPYTIVRNIKGTPLAIRMLTTLIAF